MVEEFVRSFVALIAILNPVGAVPVFVSLMGGAEPRVRAKNARVAALTVLVILLLSALAGRWVLAAFGLSLSALRAGGGLVIVLMGLEMLRGQPTAVQHDTAPESTADTIVVPFAMPTLAGPGSIATAITLAADKRGVEHVLTVGAAGVLASFVVFLTLLGAGYFERVMSPRAQRILLRFMGLILVSLGAQFMLGGAKEFWTQG